MTTILHVENHPRWSRYTGLFDGAQVWLNITVEAHLSGISINPARSLASSVLTGDVGVLWIYFTAPPLGMLGAAEAFVRRRGVHAVLCAKLYHHTTARCIFHCRFGEHSS
jgi:aquaporin Z